MYLGSGQSLTAILGGAPAVTAPTCTADYVTPQGGVSTPVALGAVAVTITPAPNGDKVTTVDGLTVYNGDTSSATVTIYLVSGGTSYPRWAGILAAGDTMQYSLGQGWKVTDSSGNNKSTAQINPTFSGITGANLITVPDNLADALSITEGSNEYVTIVTTNGSEAVLFKKTVRLDTINVSTDTTTGTKIGTAATQKLALWNATPIVQPANTVDYVTMMVNVGLRASGGTAAATFPGRLTGQLLNAGPAGIDTYGAAMTIDVTKGYHVIAGVNGTSATVAFTPSAAGTAGDLLTILTAADASGTVTATFASTFHSSGTQATTGSHFSSITFQSDGTRWLELCRTTNLA